MSRLVPYLSEATIERDATALLTEYAHARGAAIAPPIPIEDIVEKHLKLRIEFDDAHKLFGVPRDPECDADILGAIFFDEARIVIDESLDPEERPGIEGRSRSGMKVVVIGVCIGGSLLRTRRRVRCLAGQRLHPSSAGRVRLRNGRNGRPTFTLRAC